MNLFVPLLIAFLMGSLVLGAITKNDPWKDALGLVVSFWLGIAGCAWVVFLSMLIAGRYDPLNIIITTFVLLVFCCLFCYYRQGSPFAFFQGTSMSSWLKFLLVVLIFWLLTKGLSHHNFYGDWDAWSFWNLRARHLVLAQSHWKDIFIYDTQAKHPWLLPYWTVFGWAWLGGQSYVFSFLSAQIFGVIVLATVFFSTLYLTKNENASFLAALWLASVPYFVLHSISQYADVLTASLILLSVILLLRLYQQKTKGNALMLGIMLGVMSFSKDEGIASASIITVLTILFFRKDRGIYLPFLGGLAVSSVSTLLVKWWMYPAPSGVNSIYLPHIVEGGRWLEIIQYFMAKLSMPIYGGILIIPLGLLVSRLLKPLDKQDRIMAAFLVMFIILFFFLYAVVSGNLHWRLLATADRLVYQILPLATVFLFYRFYRIL